MTQQGPRQGPRSTAPAFILQYGGGGTLKSTVSGELAADGGVGLAPATGMEPVQTYLQVPVAAFAAEQVGEAVQRLPALIRAGYFVTIQPRSLIEALSWLPYLKAAGVWCVVFDDVSLFAHDQLADMKQLAHNEALKAALAAGSGEAKGADLRAVYGQLGDVGIVLRKVLTGLGITVVINAHEKETKGGMIRPDFPGNVMGKQLVHGCSVAVRSAPHPDAWGSKGIAHHCAMPDSTGKNRLALGGAPAWVQPSLRALLVDSGRRVPRHPSRIWMDGVMEGAAKMVLAGRDFEEIKAEFLGWNERAGQNPAHVTWALREGLSLGMYRQHHRNGASYWSDLAPPATGAGGPALQVPPPPPPGGPM